MAIRPSTPEIITVNSEDLQTAVRDLLPSQNGFGSELQATNVITPIIDLTPTAEGSTLPVSMQQALSYDSQTVFSVSNTSSVLINSTGFYRVVGVSTINGETDGNRECLLSMSDGLSNKNVFVHINSNNGTLGATDILFDLVFFLGAGDSLSASTNDDACKIAGSHRQIADAQGTLVNPSGFPV